MPLRPPLGPALTPHFYIVKLGFTAVYIKYHTVKYCSMLHRRFIVMTTRLLVLNNTWSIVSEKKGQIEISDSSKSFDYIIWCARIVWFSSREKFYHMQ